MRTRITAAAAIACTLGTLAAHAQFSQYATPGSLAERPAPLQRTLESGADEARWSVGRLRVDPRLWLREVAYEDNVFASPETDDRVSDFRAKMGGGLVSYLNFGPKVITSAYVLPEYNWWKDEDELRELSFNAGLGVFGFFNRMTLTAEGQAIERQRRLNAELEVPIDVAEDRGALSVEVDLSGVWSVFGTVEERRVRNTGNLPDDLATIRLSTLDLDLTSYGGGVRYHFSDEISLALGYWDSETDFPDDPGLRSNSADGPLLEISADGGTLAFDAALRELSIEFAEGSALQGSDELTYEARLAWTLGELTDATLFGARNVVYSAVVETGVFLEDRIGLSLRRDFGERFQGRAFYELGDTETIEVVGFDPAPAYEFDSYGVTVDFELSANSTLTASLAETTFESELPGFDRKSSSVGIGVRFGDDSLPW
jgi:hypothetical protein